MSREQDRTGLEVAIIGMAGRFPGARDIEAFWCNLRAGVESITHFSDAELISSGFAPELLANPNFVKAKPMLDGVDRFDAAFFHYAPREAEIMDPQHRLFLECCWAAMEDAGHTPGAEALVGVYAGTGMNGYLLQNLVTNLPLLQSLGNLQAVVGNDKDYLATRVSYKLDLQGPSISVQTACSTSLVALHLACQGLLNGECDLALAGGVSINLPERAGYLYEKEGILSPDGHCRTFDARGQGTIFGSGLGVVVLRRLEEALAAGDRIRAVIKGSAVNNDGAAKVGFTAPRVEGQAKVIRTALRAAEVDPGTVTYIEAHGTATPLGDPIELQALTEVFASRTRKKRFCALGSVKTNIGHLDTAAGIAGLIKTVLALEHREIPPSLHFERPNPGIDLADGPFYVNARLAEWRQEDGVPRRAGVSSFGIGGTNAHVVLEEGRPREPGSPSRPWQLLVLSARSVTALERSTQQLADHLRWSSDDLADIAFTLQNGRRAFGQRRVLVCRDRDDAARALDGDPERLLTRLAERDLTTAWLFPGQGAQHPGMAADLYETEPTFRARIDACSERLRPRLDLDLRSVLYPSPERAGEAVRLLQQTAVAQPALFAVSVALAELWQEWGIRPAALLGHSVGEYAAAAVAGVFSLEEGLDLVAERGRLMQEMPVGAVLSVPLSAAELLSELPRELAVAAINAPGLCVVSGALEPVEAFAERMAARGVETVRLHTSHAFHSAMMEPVMDRFIEAIKQIRLQPPRIPLLSNLTGTWMTATEATDPGMWARHLRQTVRFGEGLEELFRQSDQVLLEVGPGHTLSSLVQRHPGRPRGQAVLSSLPHPQDATPAAASLLTALGRLWLAGVAPDWQRFYRGERRLRVGLPTYPFEGQRYWIEPGRWPGAEPGALRPASAVAEAVAVALDPATEPAPGDHPRPELDTPYVAPRTATERRIATVWQALLGLDRVGVHDVFLELGGHSLLATRIVAELGRVLHLELPIRSLFETPTVARLAQVVERRLAERGEGSPDAPELPVIVPDPARRSEPFPLTDVQEAYWIGRGGSFELGNVATHFYVEMEGEGIDLERLGHALRRLIERHDMLRAVVLADGRQQILAEVPSYRIRVLDVAGLRPEEQVAGLERVRREMSHQVLPSDRWPLFEVRASLLAGGGVRLHVSFDFLIGDAWSIHLLTRDWGRLYADPLVELPLLELSFRDYILAEETLHDSPLYRRALEYWRRRLPALPAGPDLPLAKSPSAVTQPRFVRRAARLDEEAWRRLKERAAHEGITPSVLLLGAFSEVLAAWSRVPRFLLNLTLFQRLPLHPEVEEVVGDFTSLTLVEVDASRPEPFLARARRVQDRLLEDLEHCYVSGVRVLRELAQGSGARRGPVVPVVFTSTLGLPDLGSSASGLGSSALRQVYGISQTPQVWLDHQVSEARGALGFTWDTVDELFPPGLLDDMFAAYRGLLDRLARDPAAWEERPGLVPEAHLLACRPEGPAAPVRQALLHQLFLDQAEAQPEQTAVVAPYRSLTYRDLRCRATRLAARLRSRGARPGALVAVAMEKGWEQVVAVLAVLEAGGAYLPVDPALPKERFHYLLAYGEATLAITQPWLEAKLDWPEGVIRLTVEEEPGPDRSPLPPAQEPGDLAYVIFTSGSTGLPKGVMIDHRGAVNTVVDINRRFGIGPSDRILALSSLSFDLSVYDLFGVLAAGGTIVIPAAGTSRDPLHWEELMRREGVTLWNSVPALMEMLVEHLSGAGRSLPSGLRLVMMSGDWLPLTLPHRIRALSAQAAPVEVISLGGATEASIWSILHPIGEVDPAWASIPYGRAMDNQAVHVLDEDLAARPIWVPGQLYIGGVGLAQGYWRDPQKTAASFIVHPQTGERLYRTGDLGRWLPDGNIELFGREDLQVKVQGHRIELGEIEAVLLDHPAVRACAVAALGERHQKRLVGYVVFKARQSATEEEIRRFLEGRLPRYMVPPGLVVLPELPLSANGKVDRGALPSPEKGPRSAAAIPAPPVDERQRRMAEIWAEVLGVDQVGMDDNFFTLGGDSILGIQIVSRANRAGISITPDQIFTHPTIAELVRLVPGAERPRRSAAVGEPVVGPVPLTPIQHWMFEQELLDPHHWNQAVLLEPREALDGTALRRAVEALVVHHDALRLRFAAGPIGWRQFNAPPDDRVPLAALDLSSLPVDRRLAALEGAAAALEASLDLAQGPLLRIAHFELGGEVGSRLLVILHHLVVDGLSWRILLEDLESGYRQAALGDEVALPPKTTSFRAWAERLNEHAWAGGGEEELEYWLTLEQNRVRPLPVDFPGGHAGNTEDSARTVVVSLGEEETRALLQRAPQVLRAQIQEVLLAALAQAVSTWAGGPLWVDLEVHGRESLFSGLDLSRVVGWFTAVYPLLLDAPSGDLSAALGAAKERLRQVPGKGVGYGVLRYLNPKPRVGERLRALPQPQIGFNYLGQLDQVVSEATLLRAARESTGPWSSPRLKRRHLLFVYGSVTGGRLQMGIGYSENVHRRETVEALAEGFGRALRHLAAACEAPGVEAWVPSDFPLAGLDREQLTAALGSVRGDCRIEDLYRLSSTQEGILFHWLYSGDPSLYVTSFGCTLRGLDAPAFATAWQELVDRHSVLRTAFIWEGLRHPVQVVSERIEVAWERGDWRELTAAEREARWKKALRLAPLSIREVSRAPLLRLTLFQVEEDVYRFLFIHHHLILDGWSLPLLLQEVFVHYEVYRQGRELRSARPHPFREYIGWLYGQDLREAESFWRRSLAGFTTPTRLGIDRGSPGEPVREADHRELRLPAEATSRLLALCRAHQLTLNTLVQGAWALVLARHADRDEVCFGSVVAGRPPSIPGIETMLGVFINTLPVRLAVPPSASAATWLRGLQAQQVEMRRYEYSPLAQVQHWSEVPRGLPLFESILVFENYQTPAESTQSAGSGLEVGGAQADIKTSYPLVFGGRPGEELSLSLSFDVQRFAAVEAARMLDLCRQFFAELCVDPGRSLGSLPVLTEVERQQIAEWNATAADSPPDRYLHELVEEQVERTPGAVAVTSEEGQLTYRELDRLAGRLARRLRSVGVGPEVRVGICAERSLDLVVGMLAVLKAGGAYVPLDPAYPAGRLAAILEDAEVSVLLAQEHLLAVLPAHHAQVIRLDEPERGKARADSLDLRPLEPGAGPGSLAYTIFTSGSTGRPKGILVPHSALANHAYGVIARYQLTPDDRVLQFASPAFDVAAEEVFPTWARGGTAVLWPPEAKASMAEFLRFVADRQLSVLNLPAPFWHALVEELRSDSMLPRCVRLVVVGSDRVLPRDWADWPRLAGGVPLENAFGLTETTITTTLYRQPAGGEGRELPSVPIGRPIPGAQCYLVDRTLAPAAGGVAGELAIAGVCLARGYLGRPDLTAESFVPDPFGEPGSRLYRTGDLARYLHAGEIEYLGRIDHQVKVRGFRIELGEIEAALALHSAVRQGVVVAREEPGGHKRLVAYLTVVEGAPPAVAELRGWLGESLPDYMVPAAFVFLDVLPLTASGKVDRLSLPAPDSFSGSGRESYAAPRAAVEETLVTIWAEILGVERVGIHDSFFELGGDSILCIQVVARAQRAGLRLTPHQIFEHRTIAGLATVVQEEGASRHEQGAMSGPVPLAPVQRQFFSERPVDPNHFNQALLLKLREPVSPDLLARSAAHLLVHHDALRLRFHCDDGEWRQTAAGPGGDVPFSVVDLSALSLSVRGAAQERAAAAGQVSLRLATGPLVRALFFRRDGESDRLLLAIHHLVVDGVSWRILLEDLESGCRQLARSGTVVLPPKTTSFRKWGESLERHARSAEVQAEVGYWVTVAQASAACLPLDLPGSANLVGSSRILSVGLDPDETEALLKEVPKTYQTQVNDVLLTALARALRRWTGEPTVRIDLEGHGREEVFPGVDLSRTVGWFTAIFPVLLTLSPAGGPGEDLKAIKEQLRNIPGRGLGYGVLRYLGGPAVAERLRSSLAEVLFNYLGQMDRGLPEALLFEIAEEPAGSPYSLRQDRSHLLEINGRVAGRRLWLSFTYSENLHRRQTVEALAAGTMNELRELIRHCQSVEADGFTPSDFPMMSFTQGELDELVADLAGDLE
ncbi:MAG TPA: amino acid adenylation domain-containing protein [Thermoanaerobaculia bacterium]|nr:amino acid adenylation domain-containing protein [Thermoanaerobaculia bacterium]